MNVQKLDAAISAFLKNQKSKLFRYEKYRYIL